jgi:hypothetical protein
MVSMFAKVIIELQGYLVGKGYIFSYGDYSYRCSFVPLITPKRRTRSALRTFLLVSFTPVFYYFSITCDYLMLVTPDMMTAVVVVLLQDVKICRGLFELVRQIGY